MDRNACIAVACALAAHALALVVWPAQSPVLVPVERSSQDAPRTPLESSVPVAVEFVLLDTNLLFDDAQSVVASDRALKTDIKLRTERRARGDRPPPSTPNSTPPLEQSPRGPSGTSLRMRGLNPAGDINPRRGSGLEAAIAAAAAHVPAASPRSDLLGASAGPRIENSPWQNSGHGTMRAKGEPYEATIARDGTIAFEDRPNIQMDGISTMPDSLIPSLSGHFDVTDAVMKSLGEVLYSYRKLKLMDQSREMRAGMAMRSNEESLQTALATYPARLRKLWRDPRYSLVERKTLLFSLWDECAETGTQSVVATARSIRASTVAFIQRVLPEDAAEAYTPSELTELNRQRQSAELFAPYSN